MSYDFEHRHRKMANIGSKRQVRQLSVNEKLEAIQRVHEGESKASVARVMGVPESTLRGWCKNENKLHAMAIKTADSPVVSLTTPVDGPSEAKRPKEDFTYWSQASTSESWFWRWYKHYGFHNPVEPLPLVKSKSTLDTVLLNLNNNNVKEEVKENNAISSDEDEPPETAAEALKHGEKFLRWLECCSDPSLTAVQLLQFRYLLNNVRSCAERRANKNKIVLPRARRK